MKSAVILLVVAAILVSAGCSAAVWGNLTVLLISIAIFFCTLSLDMPSAHQTLSGESRGENRQTTGTGNGNDGVTADRNRTLG